jgi:hypothetical protein
MQIDRSADSRFSLSPEAEKNQESSRTRAVLPRYVISLTSRPLRGPPPYDGFMPHEGRSASWTAEKSAPAAL